MKTKTCAKCNTDKTILEFYKNKNIHDGHSTQCKKCQQHTASEYFKTKDGLISRIYNHQKISSKRRGHVPPTYTKHELNEWLYSENKFHELYDFWKTVEYVSYYKPSIDRLDDYKPYSFDNIQLTTWGYNNDRGYRDRKNGINNKVNKEVLQYTRDNTFVSKFHSLNEASRVSGICLGNMSNCCNGKRKSAGGYIWKYKELK